MRFRKAPVIPPRPVSVMRGPTEEERAARPEPIADSIQIAVITRDPYTFGWRAAYTPARTPRWSCWVGEYVDGNWQILGTWVMDFPHTNRAGYGDDYPTMEAHGWHSNAIMAHAAATRAGRTLREDYLARFVPDPYPTWRTL